MDRRQAINYVALLSGGAISLPFVAGILNGCQPSMKLDWQPTFFEQEEALVLSQIADIILPPTENSPSATQVYVPEFIDLMVKDCLKRTDQEAFRSGLRDLLVKFKAKYGVAFRHATMPNQINYIDSIDQASFAKSEKTSCFKTIKQLVLLGYFTSKKIMEEHLDYHAIPGRFDACIPYDGTALYVDNNVEGRLLM